MLYCLKPSFCQFFDLMQFLSFKMKKSFTEASTFSWLLEHHKCRKWAMDQNKQWFGGPRTRLYTGCGINLVLSSSWSLFWKLACMEILQNLWLTLESYEKELSDHYRKGNKTENWRNLPSYVSKNKCSIVFNKQTFFSCDKGIQYGLLQKKKKKKKKRLKWSNIKLVVNVKARISKKKKTKKKK